MSETQFPFFNLIKFIYQQKNKPLNIQSAYEFDVNKYFPQVISILLNKNIPNLKTVTTSTIDYQQNLKKTISFLKKQKILANISKNPTSEEEIERIIIDTVRAVFLKMDVDEVFTKSKTIFKSKDLGNEYNNPQDIFSGNFLLTLLKALSADEKVYIPETINVRTEFARLIKIFQEVNVPLVIGSDSFEYENPDFFLIQVQIIFLVFSRKKKIVDDQPHDLHRTTAPHHLSRSSSFSSIPKLMQNDNNKNSILITSKTDPQIPESDPFYYDKGDHLNIVNSLINDNSQKIDHISNLLTGNAPKLYLIVRNVVGRNVISNRDEKNVNAILHILGERFPESKSIFDEFIENKKNSDQRRCIRTLLKCVYFDKEGNDILMERCQAIFHDYRIKFDDFDAFFKSKGLLFLPLLQRLAFIKYSDINIIGIYPPNNLSLTDLHKYFNKLNIPFILAKNSFEKDYKDIIFKYQTKVIIDQFDNEYFEKIVKNCKHDIYNDNLPPLLKTINVIGSRKGIYFKSFESVIDGHLLPYFIECLLQKSLKDTIKINKSQQLTKAESEQNVENVIQYLKTLKTKFNVLLFNFKNPKMLKSSAKMLCKNLINLFFLKKSKKELFERCDSILGRNIHVMSIDDFERGKVFAGLLRFLTQFKFKFKNDYEAMNFNVVSAEYEKLNIPIVIDENLFLNPSENEFAILCQLQFIFDRLDNELRIEKPSFVVAEIFLRSAKSLQNIHILHAYILNISVKAKKKSFGDRKVSVTDIKIMDRKLEKKEPTLEEYFENLDLEKKKEEEALNSIDHVLKINPNPSEFWNPFDDEYSSLTKIKIKKFIKCENDLLVTKEKSEKSYGKTDYAELLSDDLEAFFKNPDANSRQYKKKVKNNNQEKYYKLFVYDEDSSKWEFDYNEFEAFAKDNHINPIEGKPAIKTNLILFINPVEEDLMLLKNNYFQNVSKFDDKLFIYSLSYNDSDDKYSPIFLFLHIPQKTISNQAYAIMQIYVYLYSVSSIQILPINIKSNSCEKNLSEQLKIVEILNNVSKRINIDPSNKSKLIFLANYSVPSYESNFCKNISEKGNFAKELKKKFPQMKVIPVGFESNKDVFKEIINDVTSDYEIFYKDISMKFQNYPQYEISGLYIKIITQPQETYYRNLKLLIEERFEDIKRNELKSDIDIYLLLLDEFAVFNPRNDTEFNQIYKSIIFEILKDIPDTKNKNQKYLEKKLKCEMKSEFEKAKIELDKVIKSKLYWEDQQISILINSYLLLMDKVFYTIIYKIGFGRIAGIVYSEYKSILDDQKNAIHDLIKSEFKEFAEIVLKRSEQREIDLRNNLIKSTKYVMKESENLKDREVIVGDGQKLEDIIEQDF